MVIRHAKQTDLSRLIDIYNQAVLAGGITADLEVVSIEQRQSWFVQHQSERTPLFVAVDHQQIVGYGTLSLYRDKPGWLGVGEVSYYLDSSAQGKGLGTQLLAHLVSFAEQHDYTHLVGNINADNIASKRLLEKFGFHHNDTVPRFAKSRTGWMDIATYIKVIEKS
jgi:phosphinothricin acetyltransferase